MSQLETHFLAEDPSIVLIANNTVLRSYVVKMLQHQSLQVIIIDFDKLFTGDYDLKILENAYKIVWLYESKEDSYDNYLNVLSILKEINTPTIVISNIIVNIKNFNSDLLENWRIRSEKQLQFIVDCNYYLPKASFIFVQDLIINDELGTSLEFIVENINQGILVNPNINLSFVEVDAFLEKLKKLLFVPGKQSSVLIKGEISDSSQIIDLLKKIYDAYHNVNTEIISDIVDVLEPIPFSTKIELVKFNLRSIATKIVKNLKTPQLIEEKLNIEKPELKTTSFSDHDVNNFNNKYSSDYDVGARPLGEIVDNSTLSVPTTIKVSSVSFPAPTAIKDTNDVPAPTAIKTSNTSVPLTNYISSEPSAIKVEKANQQIDVNNEIQRIFQTSRTDVKVNRIRKIAKTTTKITKKSLRKRLLFIGGIGITGAAIGVLVLALIFVVSQSILKKELLSLVLKGGISEHSIIVEKNNLGKISNFVGIQADAYGSIIDSNLISQATSMVRISEDVQVMPQVLLEANEASKNLFLQVLAGNSGKTTELAEILDDKIRLAYEKLSNIQASLEQVDFNVDSAEISSVVKEYESELVKLRSGMAIQQQLHPIISSLTGEESKKTYAIILQNNQELRPTGGFIQAIALLNFDQGTLVSHEVYSVYDLDKNLPGEIIPPEDIKKYLGEEKWYLRDSNWSPDFPTVSKQVEWFLNKSLGINVDGVIALNLFSVKDILEATGPIDLPEYNEVLTYKNLLERMEFHSEVVLVNSPESIDYSVTIFKKLINKIITIDRDNVSPLLSAIHDSLDENQLLISVFEESDQLVLHSLGWTGSLVEPQCPTRLSVVDCRVDVMAQVEANIGVNKANYYLDREINHKVIIDREKATHSRNITFTNNAKSNSWPKGTYKSYQRFYIDKKAILDQVLINGSALIDEQIAIKDYGDFKEVGIRVDVPIQKQVVVELKYSTPLDTTGNFSYVFFNQRQPGTFGDPMTVTFEHSADIKPVLIAPAAEVFGKIITFSSAHDSSLFGVEFE